MQKNVLEKPLKFYDAQVVLTKAAVSAPQYQGMMLTEQLASDAQELYQNGTLFHGPLFQSVQRVLNISDKKLTLECDPTALTCDQQGQFPGRVFNPFYGDAQFQSILIWGLAPS